MFCMQTNPSIATFQLSSAASLNLGWSQNGVLGNGLIWPKLTAFEDDDFKVAQTTNRTIIG